MFYEACPEAYESRPGNIKSDMFPFLKNVIFMGDIPYNGMFVWEELAAWVKIAPGQTLTEEEIKDFCMGIIAYYKIPRYVRFTDDFPVTISGKIQKYKMREVSVKELHLEAAEEIKTA